MKQWWRLWAKALGAKDGSSDRDADIIAGIRTVILVCYMVTNVAIVANAVRHWNNRPSDLHNQTISLYNYKVNKQSNVCHY